MQKMLKDYEHPRPKKKKKRKIYKLKLWFNEALYILFRNTFLVVNFIILFLYEI